MRLSKRQVWIILDAAYGELRKYQEDLEEMNEHMLMRCKYYQEVKKNEKFLYRFIGVLRRAWVIKNRCYIRVGREKYYAKR